MIIYGMNPVKEAVKSGMRVKEVYLSDRKDSRVREVIDLAGRSGVRVTRKEKHFFRDLKIRPLQYIAADIDFRLFPFEELVPEDQETFGVYVILDLIEDPRNLGAIIRSAAACGVDGIIIQSHRSCGITPTVFAASAGTAAHVKITQISNIKRAIKVFKDKGFHIVGADSKGTAVFWDIDYTPPTVIVVGSEGRGIRRTVRELCDAVVSIPMNSKVSSLNVSVASGVLLFELLRQRRRER